MRGTIVTDSFTRTVAGGWGSTDTGQAWTTIWAGGVFNAADWNVSGGVGTHSVPATVAYRSTYLAGFSQSYVDVAVDASIPVLPTGAALELANLMVRMTDLGTYYLCRVQIETTGAVTAVIFNPASTQLGSVTVPGITYTANLRLRVRVQSVGRVHRMKVWQASGTEPAAWVLSVTDSTYTGAGWIGIRSGIPTGNTNTLPIVFTYDNFSSVLLPAFPQDKLPLTVLAAFGADLSADPSTWPWVDITADVLADTLSITQGRSDEVGQASPAHCAFELRNDTKAYAAYNPASSRYPNVKRNTPIWITVDPATRFFGFADGWTPGWDTGGKHNIVSVSASGALRRLMQGQSPLESAMRRAIRTAPPVAYWPLEDKAGSTQIASGIPDGIPLALTGTARFANDSGLTGSQPTITMNATTGFTSCFNYDFDRGYWQVDWYMRIPSITASTETVVCQAYATGTVRRWEFCIGHNGAFNYQLLRGFDFSGATVVTSGQIGVPSWMVGEWMHLRLMAQNNGTAVDWLLVEFPVYGGGSFLSGSLASAVAGDVYSVRVPPAATLDGVSYGHLTVFDAFNYSATDLAARGYGPDTANGTPGELVTDRLARLCAENGVPLTITGTSDARMGPQAIDTFVANLRECEAADQGLLYDGFGPGLGYITRSARYNLSAALTVDMATNQVAPPFKAVDNDQRNRNSFKVDRKRGSSAVFEDRTGPLGTDAIGLYDSSATFNVAADIVLADYASWLVHMGTVEGFRYPALGLNLVRSPALIDDWVGARLNSRVDVLNVATTVTGHPPGTVSLLDEGYTETLGPKTWKVAATCSLYRPWEVFQVQHSRLGRADTAASTLVTGVTAGATSLAVRTNDGPLWTQAVADFPLDVEIGGWQITATAATTPAPTLVGVGAAAAGNATSVTPALPAGIQAGDLLMIFAGNRNDTTGTTLTPAGWTRAVDMNLGTARLFVRVATGTDVAPTITYVGVAAGDTTLAQCAAFRNVTVTFTGEADQLNASAQNVAYPAQWVPNNSLVLYLGWKPNAWTSVATLAGATEIGEPVSALGSGLGLVWDYVAQASAATIPAGSFTVTGGAAAASRGAVVAFTRDQTFTVNPVPAAISANTAVRLWRPGVLAL